MTIRAIIFDFGNVINKWQPELAFGPVGLSPEQANAEIARHDVKTWVGAVMDAGGDIDGSLADISQTDPERAAFLRTYVEHIGLAHAAAVDGTSEIIDALLGTRIRVLGMTNCGVAAFDALQQNFPIIERMEDVFVSAHERLMKPEAAAFEVLLKRNGLAAAECLFIDDSQKNVDGAKAAGLDAVRFENADQLRSDLQSRGLLA